MNYIHIWSFYIQNLSEEYYHHLLKLSPHKIIKEVAPYRKTEDKIRKMVGRLLLQKAIAETELPSDYYEKIKRTKNNKPYIDGWYNFNLSYSEKFVVLCFSPNSQVGIDIEYKKPLKFKFILDSFHLNEKKKIKLSSYPLVDFYDIWVRKEAILKAQGIGLSEGLNKVDCTDNSISFKNEQWTLQNIELNKNYTCYIAHNHKKITSIYTSISLSELIV